MTKSDQVGNDQPFIVLQTGPLVATAHTELSGDHELVEAAHRVVKVEETDGARVALPRGASTVRGIP